MPLERTPSERSTLMFESSERARQFSERVAENVQQRRRPGVRADKEVMAEEVAHEFEQQGEPVDIIREPWQHTKEEHEEAQQLVNLTFQRDLGAALRKARASRNYPRNLDLFHDVLTHEMYQLMQSSEVNKQPVGLWLILIVGIVALAVVLSGLLIFTAL